MTAPPRRRRKSHAPDGATQHRGWLDLVEISGPFLSLPVLRQAWPTLDALEKPAREALRREHAIWRDAPDADQAVWVRWVLTGLLGWGDELRDSADELDDLAMDVAEHETRVVPSFALVEPDEDVKPATTRVLGLVCPPGHSPTARVPGSRWAATYVDRVAALCRHQGVELGLVTDGRWWALVWAPKDTATGTAMFDAIVWPEAAERHVVRAFSSILARSRFFGVRDDETLPALLHASLGSQEDITEALGSQVREAVELLVAALGREDLAARERGLPSLDGVDAHEVYRGAVSVMMRIVFLLFAEERRLLPADNDLYASTYSAGQLCAELERRALEGSEDDLEYTTIGWQRLLAVFRAVHGGIEHPRLTMHAHDGSLFDPGEYPWLDLSIDDRTVLHMLRAVQYVEIGTGRLKERRSLSFQSLGVEEIGYVYEGLLAYDAFRAAEVVVGLAGKRGQEPEIELRELEKIASGHTDLTALAGELSRRFPNSGLGTVPAIARKMRPPTGAAAEEARRKLLGAAQGNAKLADRLSVFYGLLRQDLRELPLVVQPGALYVTDSPRRRNTGTHYTPRELAEEVVLHALEPLVYEPGPLQTANTSEWKLISTDGILALNVADIAMGSAAFLVAAARYLGARLIEAWTRDGDERARAYTISDVQSGEDAIVIDARREVIEHCLYGVDINPMAVEMAKLSLWLVSMDPLRPFTFLDDRLVEGDSLLGLTSIDQLEYMHLDPVEGRRLHAKPDLLDWTHGVQSLVMESADKRSAIVDLGPELDSVTRLSVKRASLYEAWDGVNHLKLAADLVGGAALGADRSDRAAGAETRGRSARGAQAFSEFISGGREKPARELAARWLRSETDEGRFHRPLHWPLTFPEVFIGGGFHAIVGNPPFLGGQKLTGALGNSYREYLIGTIGQGQRGSADLAAYFMLRSCELLRRDGHLGLLATKTVTQGFSKEVGLSRLLAAGKIIRRAVSGRPWPSQTVNLEYCIVWLSQSSLSGSSIVLDGKKVQTIEADLSARARSHGDPRVLAANNGRSFQGVIVLGPGFLLTPEQAVEIIATDSRYENVVRPYLIGRDLNQDPKLEARRWIIDFNDKSEAQASFYDICFRQVEQLVRPVRAENPRKVYRERWWQFAERRPTLREAIDGFEQVLVMSQVSSTAAPVLVRNNQVFDQQLVVFAFSDAAMLAFLSSSFHFWWTVKTSSWKRTDLTYTPSKTFATLPLCTLSDRLRALGREIEKNRSQVAASRSMGLTGVYNLLSDHQCVDEDIEKLRAIHRAIDSEVVRLYGWEERITTIGGLDHDFHKVGRAIRYTIGPAAQREVLDSLLELNHERYAAEVAQGLHNRRKGQRAKKGPQEQEGMFDA